MGRIFVKNLRHFTAHFGRYPLHPGNNQIHCFITARRKPVFHHDGGKLNAWVNANPALASNLVMITGAIAGLAAVLGGLGLVVWPVMTGINALKTGLTSSSFSAFRTIASNSSEATPLFSRERTETVTQAGCGLITEISATRPSALRP